MTEAEWMTSADPLRMLEHLRGRASERKLRLFACACCRRIWHLLDEEDRNAVEVAERFADGLAGRDELAAVARALGEPGGESWDAAGDAREAARAASAAEAWDAAAGAFEAAGCAAWAEGGAVAAAGDAEFDLHCRLLRDLFGNPFRRVPAVDPAWLSWGDGAVPRLAQEIYDHRSFGDLPLLADALERAGCTDPDILSHCRARAKHLRGCWVLDLLLEGTRVRGGEPAAFARRQR